MKYISRLKLQNFILRNFHVRGKINEDNDENYINDGNDSIDWRFN